MPRGSAPALRRPVLVISADQCNRSRLATITVAVLASNIRLAALPGNVLVAAAVTGLDDDSVVNVTQLATIDRTTAEEQLGTSPDWLMAQVDAGLQRALELR